MAKEKLPAIHLYPGDWLRDAISGCSLAAQGLWLRMMFVAHDAPVYGEIFACDLLASKVGIARRCGCSVEEFESLFTELLEAGVPRVVNGMIVSKRMIDDAKLRDIRAKAGRKGGKQTGKQNSSKRQANRQANIKQNTEDENENEDVSENESLDSFEEFWKAFPSGRKKSKGRARAAFEKAAKKCEPTEIINAAAEYAASHEGRGEFVKMPETWLNGECWLDDRAAWSAKGGSDGRRNDFISSQRHDPSTAKGRSGVVGF
jgi:hypothetical protein